MTVTYKEVRRLIRVKTKDQQKVTFSDYEIKEAVNECLRYLSGSYALQNADFLEKIVEYDERKMNKEIAIENESLPDEDKKPLYDFAHLGVELPKDFLSIQGISCSHRGARFHDGRLAPVAAIDDVHVGEYKVLGQRLYVGEPYFKLLYRIAIPQIMNEEDTIELPFMFKDTIAKIAVMILQNNPSTDTLMEAINDDVASLVPRRRYVNARKAMPFMV